MTGQVNQVLDVFEKNWKSHLEDLENLVRIPSVSFPGFDPKEVRRSAEAVATLLKKRGLEKVQILELEGAHPYVFGERVKAKGAPTLLLYAHHDVQPPGRPEVWKSKPFEPTVMEGPGGPRLYGRGTADDKAGVIVHTAAIASYLAATDELPVNVKVVIEGEEEIGSSHLPQFLERYRDLVAADILVLTDTGNFDSGVPALTTALRGLIAVGVEVRALRKTVHSGMWGGPVPDPVMALSKMLAKLVDEKGRIAIPGVWEQTQRPTPEERAAFAKTEISEEEFRKQAGVLPEVQLLKEDVPLLSQVWFYPSLTVTAIQASSRAQAANIINDSAWAKVTIRLSPGMDEKKTLEQLRTYLEKIVPWGLTLELQVDAAAGPWKASTGGKHAPVFEAAERALAKGYGKAPVRMGSGGSIPFVKPFADALGGAPPLLIGVEDPYTNAHGENESMLISDFKAACRSQIYLFDELARLGKS